MTTTQGNSTDPHLAPDQVLAVCGDLVQDVVVWQLEPLRRGTDTRSQVSIQRGGSAANVAAFAAPRRPTRFFGCVGADLGGHVLRQELQSHGVDTRLQTRSTTGTIVVVVDPSGERSMFPSRGASALIEPVPDADLDGVALLHLTAYTFESGTSPNTALHMVDAVRRRGGRVSFDASSAGLIEALGRERFWELLERLGPDFLSANEDEVAVLDLDRQLHRLPSTTLLARAGARDTRILRHGEVAVSVPVPPLDAPPRDLTGAGDAFNAGFLCSVLDGDPLPDAVAAGHALARSVLCSPGATLAE